MNLLWVLACVCVALGLLGTILPLLPGPVLVFVGLVLAAWSDGFSRVGFLPLTLIALLVAAAYAVDLLATSLGAKKVGASAWAAWGAVLGSIIGFSVGFGLPGLIVGPFVGAFAGELLYRRHRVPPPLEPGASTMSGDVRQAGKAGVGAWLGILLGGFLKLAIVLAMLGVFVVAYVL